MGEFQRGGGAKGKPPQGAESDPQYLRTAGVEAERAAAASQIQRTLRVWRKAADEGGEKKNDEEKEENESEEEKEGEEKAQGKEDKEGKEEQAEEKAPEIAAKLDGVARKIFLADKDKVERLPPPPVPDGCSGLSDFGTRIMKWGTGDAEALARMANVTKAEMVAGKVTAALASQWAAFYENEKKRVPQNPSAGGRAQLMRHVASLL